MALNNANPIFGIKKIITIGDDVLVISEFTFPNPYVVGGIAFAPSDFQLRTLDFVMPICASGGWSLALDQANAKIKALGSNGAAPAALAEATAIDLSAIKFYLLAFGKR